MCMYGFFIIKILYTEFFLKYILHCHIRNSCIISSLCSVLLPPGTVFSHFFPGSSSEQPLEVGMSKDWYSPLFSIYLCSLTNFIQSHCSKCHLLLKTTIFIFSTLMHPWPGDFHFQLPICCVHLTAISGKTPPGQNFSFFLKSSSQSITPSSIQCLRPNTQKSALLSPLLSFSILNPSARTVNSIHTLYTISTASNLVSRSTLSHLNHYCLISSHPKYISTQQHSSPIWKSSRLCTAMGMKSTPYQAYLYKVAPVCPFYTSYSPTMLQPHWPSSLDTQSAYTLLTCSSICFDAAVSHFSG